MDFVIRFDHMDNRLGHYRLHEKFPAIICEYSIGTFVTGSHTREGKRFPEGSCR